MDLRKTMLNFMLAAGTIFFISCEKEDDTPRREGYARGVFIACEGAFNASNGSISWYDPDSNIVVNNLFEHVNGRPAGDVVQSFTLAGDLGVIVANNSQKIEVVDLVTFESISTITGFTYPRYFAYTGKGSGYLSNGNLDGHVYSIELESGIITDTIDVGMGPEQMVVAGNHLYVANSGGWAFDNTVSVIDTRSNEVVATVEAGDIPVALVTDRDNNVWVLSRGKVVYNETWTEIIEETDSRLVRINPVTLKADRSVVIGTTGDGFNPSWLSVSADGGTLYYGEAGGVYSMSIDSQVQPSEPMLPENFSYAATCPSTGRFFTLEITDYTSPGKLHIFNDDDQEETYNTGIAPRVMAFGQR